jgi:dihydroneopterin aldolase
MNSMDKIILQGMRVTARHGLLPHERAIAQVFSIDLELYLDLRPAGCSDRLEDSIDYAAVAATVRQVFTGGPYALLEALAEACAETLLHSYPLTGVKVRLAKLHAPMGADVSQVAVEILRYS